MGEKRYSASEIARMFGVSPDTIRYYDNIGVITPERGENKYRYFDLPQISDTLAVIRLRSAGVSIEQIQRLAGAEGREDVLQVLEQTGIELSEKERELRRQREELRCLQQELSRLQEPEGITLRYLPAHHVYYHPDNESLSEIVQLFQESLRAVSPPPRIVYSYDTDALLAGELVCRTRAQYSKVPLPQKAGRVRLRERTLCATFIYRGPREQRPEAYRRLPEWAREHRFAAGGDLLEFYLISSENMYAAELWLPVEAL